MSFNLPPAAPPIDPRHRRIPEARIEDMLLLAGWVCREDVGQEAPSRAIIRESLERCLAAGLGHARDFSGQRRFDPAEVLNFLIWASLSDFDDFWIRRIVPTGRARARDLEGPSQTGARFRVALERTFDLRAHERRRVRLRLPLPLAAAHAGTVLITPKAPPGVDGEVKLSDGRLEVTLTSAPAGTTTIGAVVEFATAPEGAVQGGAGLGREEAERYLRPIEGSVHITPRVLGLTRRLETPGNPFKTTRAIWSYMNRNLGFGVLRYDEAPTRATGDWILDTGRYDCQLGSALFISLCRAGGIPARMVSGHFLYNDSPFSHFWAEVWIEGRGWLSFDFIGWGLSAGGRDQAWLDRFGGRTEPRLVSQRLPLAFTGPMSVRFPAAWQMLQTRAGKGVDEAYTDISDGALIYKDHIEVERLE